MDNNVTLVVNQQESQYGKLIGFEFTNNGEHLNVSMQIGLLYRILTGKELADLGAKEREILCLNNPL